MWANKKEGETKNHRNCLQQTYTRVLNDKRQITKARNKMLQNREGSEKKHTLQTKSENVQLAICRGGHALGKFWYATLLELLTVIDVRLTFCLNEQVSYNCDYEWNNWNMAAKSRILSENGPTKPTAPYLVPTAVAVGPAV